MDDDRFTFVLDMDQIPSEDVLHVVGDQPEFSVHDIAVYHPDPNLKPHACVVTHVHPTFNGTGALYGIAFADGSMMLTVPQYDLHVYK